MPLYDLLNKQKDEDDEEKKQETEQDGLTKKFKKQFYENLSKDPTLRVRSRAATLGVRG
jgi:hypothetical protein